MKAAVLQTLDIRVTEQSDKATTSCRWEFPPHCTFRARHYNNQVVCMVSVCLSVCLLTENLFMATDTAGCIG